MTWPGGEDQCAVKAREVPGRMHGSVSIPEHVQEATQHDCSLHSFVVPTKSHRPHLPQVPGMLGVPFLHTLGNVNCKSMIKSSITYLHLAVLSLYFEQRRTHEDGFLIQSITDYSQCVTQDLLKDFC